MKFIKKVTHFSPVLTNVLNPYQTGWNINELEEGR